MFSAIVNTFDSQWNAGALAECQFRELARRVELANDSRRKEAEQVAQAAARKKERLEAQKAGLLIALQKKHQKFAQKAKEQARHKEQLETKIVAEKVAQPLTEKMTSGRLAEKVAQKVAQKAAARVAQRAAEKALEKAAEKVAERAARKAAILAVRQKEQLETEKIAQRVALLAARQKEQLETQQGLKLAQRLAAEKAPIGTATMDARGNVVLELRVSPSGGAARAVHYWPASPDYDYVVKHIGLNPGQTKFVYPFPLNTRSPQEVLLTTV